MKDGFKTKPLTCDKQIVFDRNYSFSVGMSYFSRKSFKPPNVIFGVTWRNQNYSEPSVRTARIYKEFELNF